MKSYLLIILTFFIMIGCTEKEQLPPVVVTPSMVFKAEWDSKPEGKQWTEFALAAFEEYGKDLFSMKAPLDAAKYCPKFGELTVAQKQQFFITLISAMAKRESNFKPETSYVESFNDSKGKPVISMGLLQISQESANQKAYGCNIVKAAELYDPKTNLTCGVKILSKWIPQDNYIGSHKLGGGRYWSVLRDTSSSQAYIRQQTMALEFCK